MAGWEGGKKHEIYEAKFDGHLFYDLFLQDKGAWPPLDILLDLLLLQTVASLKNLSAL